MAYKLQFMPAFDIDLSTAETYLSDYSPKAAKRLTSAVEKQTLLLLSHPYMYPIYEVDPDFRIMPLPYQYLCFYIVNTDTEVIEVHHLFRSMQRIHDLL